jgi:predicted N-acetyltransferase YhbS
MGKGADDQLIARPITIRTLTSTDSIEDLTDLIHDAYRGLGDMGLNYTAVDQDVGTTFKRIERGECLVAEVDSAVVGTVTWYPPQTVDYCPWYRRPDVAIFGQLAVRPEDQGCGIGSALISEVERRARERGAGELALDTAEPAGHLIEYYGRRGFRAVETVQWKGKTYRSVVMSKRLHSHRITGALPGTIA